MAVLHKCYFRLPPKQKILLGNHGKPHTFHPIEGVSYEQIGGYIAGFIKEWIEDIT